MSSSAPANPLRAAQKDWIAFWQAIPRESLGAVNLYSEATGLLRDAMISYRSGAIGAAAVTCRAVIEAAGYSALFSVRIGEAGWKYVFPLNPKGKFRKVEFEEVKKGIAKLGIISVRTMGQIGRVQEHGNFIAHLASKKAGEVLRVSKSRTRVALRPMRIWVTRREAATDIACARKVLLALMGWSCAQPIQQLRQK